MKKIEISRFDLSEYLNSEEDIQEYMNQVLSDGDTEEFLRALGYISKARGMTKIAEETGLGRESLYKSFSPGTSPKFDTVAKVLKALNLKLEAHTIQEVLQ